MKASEIRELNDADLATRIAELERERFNLRFQSATTQLEDPLRQRHIRRDIARLKTVQRERAEGGTGGTTAATTAAKKSARGKRAQAKATGGTTTKATAARKAPAKKKAATGAGR